MDPQTRQGLLPNLRSQKEKAMEETVYLVEATTRNKLSAWFITRKWRKQGRKVISIPVSPCRTLIGVVVSRRAQ